MHDDNQPGCHDEGQEKAIFYKLKPLSSRVIIFILAVHLEIQGYEIARNWSE